MLAGACVGLAVHAPFYISIPLSVMAVVAVRFAWDRSAGWVVQRQIRFARYNDGVDVYETCAEYSVPMRRYQALQAVEACAKRWPDYQFRVHRERVKPV